MRGSCCPTLRRKNFTYAAVIFIGALIALIWIAFAIRIGLYVLSEYRTGIAYVGKKATAYRQKDPGLYWVLLSAHVVSVILFLWVGFPLSQSFIAGYLG